MVNNLCFQVLLSGRELEILAEFEPEEFASDKYDLEFLRSIQEAADRHLAEKNEIRNALGLLKIYHNSNNSSSDTRGARPKEPKSPAKKPRKSSRKS